MDHRVLKGIPDLAVNGSNACSTQNSDMQTSTTSVRILDNSHALDNL